MDSRTRRGTATWPGRLLLPVLAVTVLGGCLGEPEIEDRWTRLDIRSASLAQSQTVRPGPLDSIRVGTSITYRAIVTGFAVADLRASPTVSPLVVFVGPTSGRERMASDIDNILANSVSVGRATRAITGWDHLIQDIDFTFNAVVPATMDSSGTPPGLFLVFYLGSGVEIERADGSDTLVVTPFISSQREILPVGLELLVSP